MESLRLDTLAAQVVAWHNRHPLARRITAAQVQSMGYVVLPGMQPVQLAQVPVLDECLVPTDAAAEAPVAAFAQDTDSAVAEAAAAAPLDAAPSAASEAIPATVQASPEAVVEAPDATAGAEGTAEPPPEAAPDAGPAAPADPVTDASTAAFAAAFEEPAAPAAETTGAGQEAGDALPADAPPAAAPPATAPPATAPPAAAAAMAASELAPQAAAATEPDPAAVAGAAEERPATSLRERLAARPAQQLPAPAASAEPAPAVAAAAATAPAPADMSEFRLSFSEAVLEHTGLKQLHAWAQRHARVLVVPLPARAAVRRVARDAAWSQAAAGPAERPVDLVVRTATLEVGGRRVRLLVGPGDDPAVLGPRLWSLPRVALASLPLLLLPVTAGMAWWLGAQSARQGLEMAAAAKPPAAAASVAQAAPAHEPPASHHAEPASAPAAQRPAGAAGHGADSPHAAFAALATDAAASAAAAHAAPAVSNEPPEDVEPTLGRVELPPLGPLFTDPGLEATRMRRQAARAARAAPAAASTAASPDLGAPGAATPAAAPTAAAAATPAPAVAAQAPAAAQAVPPVGYALSTRLLRTAAESEQIQVAMRTLFTLAGDPTALVQRVPVGDDWRVMGGPFSSRAAAERLRAQLMARGVKTEVIDLPPAATATAGR